MKHQEVTPEQLQQVVDAGLELAHPANAAFDNKVTARNDQAALERVNGMPGVSVTDEAYQLVEQIGDHEQDRFDKLVSIAGDLIGRNSLGERVFDTNIQTEPRIAKPETSLFDQLTAEQQEKATKVIGVMAEQFGVSAEDFSVLRVSGENGDEQLVVAHTAGNGIDLGDPKKDYDPTRSWNSIFDKKNAKNFMIKIDGQTLDTRSGMTEATYRAFIAVAEARGEMLPDSRPLSKQNGEVWTATWLTGEDADRGDAVIARVVGGQVYVYWRHRGRGRRALRVRPAVVLQ